MYLGIYGQQEQVKAYDVHTGRLSVDIVYGIHPSSEVKY